MAKKKILLVEDESWIMGGVKDSLEAEYDVIMARNADVALDYVESDGQAISLIVLDIMMPPGKRVDSGDRGRTSGVEFARIVLEEEGYKIPIIAYTVVTDPKVHTRLEQIGVKETVSKTMLPSELKSVIRRHLS